MNKTDSYLVQRDDYKTKNMLSNKINYTTSESSTSAKFSVDILSWLHPLPSHGLHFSYHIFIYNYNFCRSGICNFKSILYWEK